jgi:apolipoprotein N-acyltransferase
MNLLLCLLAGATFPLSLAPFDWWGFGVLSLATLAFALRDAAPRRGAFLAWIYGSASFATGVSWIYIAMHDFGDTSALLSGLMTAIFCLGLGAIPAAFGYCYCRWVRGHRRIQILGFATAWVLFEWLRGWLLTGFPWLYSGYGHLHTALAGWAPITGIHGLNLWVALAGAATAHWASSLPQNLKGKHWRALGASTLPLLGCFALYFLGDSLKSIEWTRDAGRPPLKVGAVQSNITQDQKWAYTQYWATLELYDQASEGLWQGNDLVIWPEAAVPALYHHALPFFDYMRERAELNDTALVTGVPTRDGDDMYNSVMVISGGSGIYNKQRLVPFGEYVPLARFIRGLIPFFDLPLSSFSRGGPGQQPLEVKGWQLAPSICYEIVYPDLVARGAQNADLLFTISNDAWFGHSIGPAQHMEMAQMRALENGRELIRVTSTGITATVDHRGNIRERLPAFTRADLRTTVHARSGQTPFNRHGSLPVLGLCALLLAASAHLSRKA